MKGEADGRTYVVAAVHSWNREVFERKLSQRPGNWVLVAERDGLSEERLKALNPHTIFFLHWSWKVPRQITEQYRCIVFHMTDVPYGRGGSPLQNLILQGYQATMLSALKMEQELDAGPVYLKKELSLSGSAQEIYERAANLAADMLGEMIDQDLVATPQSGTPVIFVRRTPDDSRVPSSLSPAKLYDFIRMLDAEGYPKAFIETDGYRIEFSCASFSDSTVTARAKVRTLVEEDK